MSWKNSQTSLGQLFIQHNKAIEAFDDINELVDWSEVEGLLSHIYNKKTGNSAYPPLMMFKALLLQAWHRLSDAVPDHSTIWRFREKLQDGTWERLLDLVNDHLAKRSLFVRTGSISIIDASVIEAKNCRPHKGKHGNNKQDPEAGYSIKKGSDGKLECTYGFKAHTNVEEDGMIQKVIFTAGNVHDSQCFEPLFTGNEVAVYGDEGYKSRKNDDVLKAKNIEIA